MMQMWRGVVFFFLFISGLGCSIAQEAVIEATTAAGEKVRLLPNGRWEFADRNKAEIQRETRRVEDEREASAQGGFFGVGRKVYPGDRDYNRGSLNPKTR